MKLPPLAALFPDEDFGFKLTLRRGEVRDFFAPSLTAEAVLAERQRWIEERPADHVVDAPDLAAVWTEVATTLGLTASGLCELGATVEPDLVVLRPDAAGAWRVRGGVVVFPTHWSLPEKVGLTLADTHAVVPGLNPAIGAAIDRFLHGLKPGAGAQRSNWGLAATEALNLHPGLGPPRLQADAPLEHVWLRVEHQLLTRLGESDAILFGIRIALHPLREVLADVDARRGLHRALATMPTAMVDYKGLRAILPALRRWTAD